MEKINKNYDRKYFFGYHDALKIYGAPKLYVLLCTETALSNHPVVIPKSSCDVHLLRSPCLNTLIKKGTKKTQTESLGL